MSSTNRVPETRLMGDEELSADDAWETLRQYGRWHLLRDAFVRFRYGDGFSHSRALAFQLCLAAVPFLIALTGLAADLGAEEGGQIVAKTVLELTPGSSDQLVEQTLGEDETGEFALVLGLITGMVALTTAMAQVERGANRMYGVERDRPALRKYVRAAVLSVVAGLPAFGGFLVLVAGEPFGDAVVSEYGWAGWIETTWDVVRWPLGLVLTVVSIALLFEQSPRRRQPGMSWLVFGAGVATVLWLIASLGLALYVQGSGSFGATYGPLTAIIALLLWAQLTSIALFLGLAFAAQLEALRVGAADPAEPDRWEPSPAA
ncbi:YihY/virulence factor BrkB family protein [Cryptosporangium phraense]|uniref:YihY/virulence factor BrkB family protein n=1 Tax=Cryptosporangium phraense TaxID=2593070 RepID=A0A545ALQ5_9ACTN|nr:YihY/virulence factor BrkB family protein [Cryptosporangium phraense]TQS42242.1 YihY/virulence factor BrkB family protein [Cryptosporangium phraense]